MLKLSSQPWKPEEQENLNITIILIPSTSNKSSGNGYNLFFKIEEAISENLIALHSTAGAQNIKTPRATGKASAHHTVPTLTQTRFIHTPFAPSPLSPHFLPTPFIVSALVLVSPFPLCVFPLSQTVVS